MSLFRVYVDGALFYHPQMSKLAITDARIEEDAENIDSMTLSAPFNHPYLSSIQPLASTIVFLQTQAFCAIIIYRSKGNLMVSFSLKQ